MSDLELTGSIVIPAHNEGRVILRTLHPLAPLIRRGVEVVVLANGCTDDTVELAASVPGVLVSSISVPSKPAALNAGDALASNFPRLYLDADIEISSVAVEAVLACLQGDRVLAARPPFAYDTVGAGRAVRAYYRARSRISDSHIHLWGAGVYALSALGHDRLGNFPEVIADDLYVDGLFAPDEISIVDSPPVIVRSPRTWRALIGTLHRVNAGNAELGQRESDPVARSSANTLRQLLRTVRSPASLVDAAIYAAAAIASRFPILRRDARWIRDESSRVTDHSMQEPSL